MKRLQLICLVTLTATFTAAYQAAAFSQDDTTMSTPTSAQRFSDPDEKTPGQAVYMKDGKPASDSDSTDPSTIRYDYDSDSGSYIPHRQ